MSYLQGFYIGVRNRLLWETALLQPVPGGYLAQFDRTHHREAFGWHFFPARDFLETPKIDWSAQS